MNQCPKKRHPIATWAARILGQDGYAHLRPLFRAFGAVGHTGGISTIPDASVLVTTGGKRVYRVNIRTGNMEHLGTFPGKLYGISWDESGTLYLAESRHAKNDIEEASRKNDLSPVQNGVVHGFHADGTRRCLQGGFTGTHQILYHQASLYVCNSGMGTLERFPIHAADSLSDREVLLDTGPDCIQGEWLGEHINSVHCSQDGSIRYIRHRHGRSAACRLDRNEVDHSHDIYQAHAHAVIDDDILICNSAHGALYSLRERRDVWNTPVTGAFSRGLACIGPTILVVGLSTYDPDRSQRQRNTGYLAVVLRKNNGTCNTLCVLPITESGDIHEIRTLDHPDPWTHNGIALTRNSLRLLARTFPV